MLSLLIWIAILWACFGIGAAALSRLRVTTSLLAEELPFAIALGMGILSYLTLALGLLGLIQVWIFVALICILALLGWRHLLRLGRLIITGIPRLKLPWAGVPLLLFFLAAGAFTLIGALAPATDIDYDGLFYHLTIPKVYIRDGSIHAIPWLSHSNFPFTLEMLYMLGLLFNGQALAKLFHFGCGWLTVCAVYAFGFRSWGARPGKWGAAILVGIPLVAWEMMSAYNELAFALYAFLAIFALTRWFRGRASGEHNGWLWAAALMCGFALGTKSLAGAVLGFAVLAILAGIPTRGAKAVVLPLIAFVIIAAAVGSPWYIKSYIWTGNPVYPFLYSVFDGRYWTADRATLYTAAQKEFGMGSGWLSFILLPWNLTMSAFRFFDLPNQLRPVNVLVWVFGPLLLALIPALLISSQVRAAGRTMLWFALFYIAVWFTLSQNGRYLIPILPGLCACAGLAVTRLLDRRGLVAATAALVLLLGLVTPLYPSFILASPAAPVAAGIESPARYLDSVFPLYTTLEAVNRATPPTARIVVFGGEPRMFYLDRDFLLGDHAAIFSSQDLATPDSLLAAFRRMGVTHLLLDMSMIRDMNSRSGLLATDLTGLRDQGRIRPTGFYGTLSLWGIVGAIGGGP